ncbi:M20/M25/M40 family metallo-hydrolase [Modestobacter excelsi]|uniref:M20/M25/M40 family metallo-hydrolase n=1 Tax=Modestobacter excelsi TaxID=2213161 RepID=UPI00110D142F|nr:M20/M25/M40 family metallo-hydrolase [Modestobacter excelsi]
MKLVLFDLGQTLEDGDVLLPGALETLEAIDALRDGDRPAARLGLVSDFDMTNDPSQVPVIQQRYYALLDDLGIRRFFEPVAERVTLSTEVGVFKPDEAVFRAAVTRAVPGLEFRDVLFVTENRSHVLAARRLGLRAVHLRGPGQPDGEVDGLTDLIPLVRAFTEQDTGPAQTAVLTAPPGAEDAIPADVGITWTRLGDVLLVSGPSDPVQEVVAGTGLTTATSTSVPRGRLHLVTQIGRCFQQEHPDVPVVVDKGRYLVVDLDPEQAAALDGSPTGCFGVRPLPASEAVFEQRTVGRPAGAAPARLRTREHALSRAAFEADLATLVGFGTRHSTRPEFLAAVEWARGELTASGCATQLQTVPVGAGTSRNLIADRVGHGSDRQLVLVGAHLDSVNLAGGPAAAAPGADDNASGAAGVLAIGRALAEEAIAHDLRLILFGGEEQGLLGSLHYVAGLDPTERSRIRAVINMDMIAGRNTDTPTVLLEGAAVSQDVIDALAAAAQEQTDVAVQTSLNPFNSDHVPFLDQGIPAVLTIEGADGANDRVHTDRDRIEFLDHVLALEILRMNVSFLVQALSEDQWVTVR